MASVTHDDRAAAASARGEDERGAALATSRRAVEAREADARESLRHLRNVLSVVRVLARRTAEEVDTVEEFRAVLDGRLAALARAQSAPGDPRAGRDLGAIFGDELLGFGLRVGEEVELTGPHVRLEARAAGLVALAAHELVAELAARGVAGAVRLEWAVDDGLKVAWTEPWRKERPPAALPHWVERAIAYELKGRMSEEISAGTLRRRLVLPAQCVRTG